MSKAEKLESMLEFLCNDVYETISADLDRTRKLHESCEYADNVKEIIDIALQNKGTLLRPIINAAAVSEIFWEIHRCIHSDNIVELDELSLLGDLIQNSLHRYCWLDDYKKFQNAKNAHEIQALLGHWKQDTAWLGGDILEGAVHNPFNKFVILACLLDQSPAFYQTYAKVISMFARLMLKSNGITSSDQIAYAQLSNSLSEIDAAIRTDIKANSNRASNKSPTRKGDPVSQSSQLKPEDALQQGLDELNTLIGLDGVKSEISRLTNFLTIRQQRLAQNLPVTSQTLHFVFTGNPGTGKTTVAHHCENSVWVSNSENLRFHRNGQGKTGWWLCWANGNQNE